MARRSDPVGRYARAILSDKEPAGPLVRLAAKRHLSDLKRTKKLKLEWRAEMAQKAIDFFREILVLESGEPFMLQPFQEFIVGSIFGWYTAEGFRRFRSAYVEIGKGNGKSPLAAGIGLYGLVADGEPAPEIYAAAVTREQGKIVFRDAARMVEASPELNALIDSQVGSLSIAAQHATFRHVSSEHRGLDGLRVHMGLIDEVHEHPTPLVVDKIRAGTKARRNALILEITNSGYDRTTVCWKHHEYSQKVLEGVIENDAWFAYVCSLDEGDDWRDRKVWRKANPCLGVSISEKYLSEQVEEALGMPSKQNIVRRLNFCEWTESHSAFIPDNVWMEGDVPVHPEALAGRECWAGMDLGSTDDLTAVVLVFPAEDGGCEVLPYFWLPEETIAKRTKQARVPYAEWVSAGWIQVTPGPVTDYDFVEKWLVEAAQRFKIKEVVFDRAWASQLVSHLADRFGDGPSATKLVKFGQGFMDMNPAVKELLRLALSKKIRHGGHPVLRWMNSNVQAEQDAAGNLKISKARSTEKVDGMVALAMSIGRAMVRAAAGSSSVYEERGLVTI